ncbi:MAG: winged helix-turn-helix domain-containing protein [Blastochloris sp.]|jgi:two-component system phosphate regulon response regulator PhoB|nr:winged helix-turn-helix domain-containing protein [Blastochloris sp.]
MFTNAKILIIDDEPDVSDMLAMSLKAAGYKVSSAENGELGLAKAKAELPSLIILDLMLPKISGIEVCKFLKRESSTAGIPIIMLTAKSEELDRIVGLELGADDYVTKPFSPRELSLRIQSVLRRTKTSEVKAEKLVIGELSLDHGRHEVLANGQSIELTATEFKLLAILMERRGRVQSRDRLLNDVWGYESVIDTRTVDTHIRRLREKLTNLADYIETVRGVGYRILDQNSGSR